MKKTVAIFFALLASFQIGQAQIYVKSANQQLIENAVRDAFFVSINSFQIQDKDGNRFGTRNNNEFGSERTLGIKTKDGVILTNRAICPWNYDSRFEKYRHDYTPVMSKTLYSEMNDVANYQAIDILKEQKSLIDSVIYVCHSDIFGDKGISVDYSKGGKDGWLIWVVVEKGADLSKSTKAEYIVLRSKQQIQGSLNNVLIDKPITEGLIMGGIYVVPHFPEIGVVSFKICGVMFEKEDKWYLYYPFVNCKATSATKSLNQEEKAELTPVTINKIAKK